MLSHVRTGESISYSDLPYTYISRTHPDRGEKPGAWFVDKHGRDKETWKTNREREKSGAGGAKRRRF